MTLKRSSEHIFDMDINKSGNSFSGKRPAESSIIEPCSKILKESNLDKNKSDEKLHIAVQENNKGLVQELLKPNTKIDINYQDGEGNTALHMAALNSFDALIHLLLKNRADSDVRNDNGETFLDVMRNIVIIHEEKRIQYLNANHPSESGKYNQIINNNLTR